MRSSSSCAVLAAALLTAAGCGSNSSNGTSNTLGGTVFGQPFTPVEVAFIGPADASCTLTGTSITYASSAVLLGFSSAPGVCALATNPCVGYKSFTFVLGGVAHAKVGGTTAPGLQPGDYTVYANLASAAPDLNGELHAAFLRPARTDATCTPTEGTPGSGTVHLDAVGPTEIRGSVDVTFGTDSLKGPFVATPCATTFDACTGKLPTCTGTATCP